MYEQVLALLEEKKYPELKALLSEMNEADIAAIFADLPPEKSIFHAKNSHSHPFPPRQSNHSACRGI